MQIEPREEDYNGPKTEENNKLIGLLYAAYFRWSKFVVHRRFAIIIFCSIISTLGAIKIANTPFANNIMGFTPYGARSLAESAIRDQFFNSTDGKGAFGVFLLVKPKKEGENMLKKEMLEEVIRIDDLVNWNITLQNHGLNKSEPFAEFCRDFCNINEPFRLFWQGFQQNLDDLDQNDAQLNVELNYPTINVFGRKMNIQPHFHGIKFVNETKAKGHQIESNMNFVEMIGLIYREQRMNGLSDEEVKDYEIKVSKFFEREFKSDLVRVLSISTSYVEAEFVRANLSMLPFLGIGLTIMLICTSICIPLSAAYFQQASIHKISLAIVACICPFMATGTALGLLFLCGLRFSPILCATPFLVLAIGVDDAYLMSHAWNRLAKKCNFQKIVQKGENNAENEEDEKIVANLLAMVLMDSGPAILISALANICADAIGAFIGSPEITILCVGNATALAFDFLFQCTYFVAVMATIGLIERKETRKKLTKKENEKNGMENSKKQNIDQKGWQKYFHDSLKTFVTKFVDFYTNSICNQICAIFILFCSTIFIAFSIFAITKFEVEMSTKELYSQDSPLLEIDNIRENRINPFYTQATVFVNNFGDLSNKSRIAEFDKFVGEFEHLNESWGPQSSMFFLRDLREYLLAKKNEEKEEEGNEIGQILNGKSSNESVINDILNCQTLIDFLDEAEYAHWKGFIRLNGIMDENEANSSFSSNSSSCPSIQRFFFTTAYHNPKLFKWSERVELLRKWRKIVDENAKTIDASVYHEEGIYLDLMDNMPTDTWQSAVATLICMATICLFLLHDLRTVLVTTLVIAIIITETMGILSISGVALNQLMMGSLVISIGFSVDLPAHFSYHFLTSDSDESKDSSTKSKLGATIRAVGLPSVQASLSTSLCVLSHYWIKLYIAQIFVRIICLTICLCLLNTLVVLPALLFLIGSIGTNLKKK